MNDFEIFNLTGNVIVSNEYKHIIDCLNKCIKSDGLICEIGLGTGWSSIIIMLCMKQTTNYNNPHILIDPYGNIDYKHNDNETTKQYNYSNKLKSEVLYKLYICASKYNYNFQYFSMEDTEFFKRFNDGVPIYNETKQLYNKYSFVLIDRPHESNIILNETLFFIDKMNIGGIIMYDDLLNYCHYDNIEPTLLKNNFELFIKTTIKAAYIYIGKL